MPAASSRSVHDRLFIGLQYLLPQHFLSRLVWSLARTRINWLKRVLIRTFLRHYPVAISEAERADPLAYDSFNDFFTRRLKQGARPIDDSPASAVSPVDGYVSQAGALESGSLLQAKGINYSAGELLGGDPALAAQFAGGAFATLYLAPHNYHRVHMPLAGTLRVARHVPGDLFSVNAATAEGVPGLFARNE
ncbi:MAG: archaetidylserine decarboxylase, partial [Steroidobacteraceae bacterium]